MGGMTRRNLAAFGGALALGSAVRPGLGAAATPASPAAADGMTLIDPELRAIARHVPTMELRTAEDLLQARRGAEARTPEARKDVPVSERRIQGARGQPDVRIYVVNADPGRTRPGILHTHGGGFVLGNARQPLADLQGLAVALDCVIVTVDYRLAPETRFSGSIEDNYAGLLWMNRAAAEIGVDPRRIAVMGESAGGGHAALLAIAARDRGEAAPVLFQMLIYPMLDDRTGSSRSPPPHIGRVLWTAEANRFGWRSFLGVEPGGLRAPPGAVPARVKNLAGLPPTFIGVGSIDLFIEEDIEYARRLIEAGVDTELHVVPGAFHAFDGIATETSVTRRFNAVKIDALKRAFARPVT